MKEKVTMMLTTHYLEEAVSLSDRIGIMANGEIKESGTADELIKKTNAVNFEDAFVAIAGQGRKTS